jgi:hypothetical protein
MNWKRILYILFVGIVALRSATVLCSRRRSATGELFLFGFDKIAYLQYNKEIDFLETPRKSISYRAEERNLIRQLSAQQKLYRPPARDHPQRYPTPDEPFG